MVILLLIFGRSQAEETNTETKLVLTKDARIVIAPQKQNPINFTSWATEPLPQPIPEPLKNPTEVVIYSLDDLIAKYFPTSQIENAKAIMQCESGGSANTISRTSDYGLFQINQVHRGRVDGDLSRLLDPETNVRVASQIWSEQGWTPWVCSRKVGL